MARKLNAADWQKAKQSEATGRPVQWAPATAPHQEDNQVPSVAGTVSNGAAKTSWRLKDLFKSLRRKTVAEKAASAVLPPPNLSKPALAIFDSLNYEQRNAVWAKYRVCSKPAEIDEYIVKTFAG